MALSSGQGFPQQPQNPGHGRAEGCWLVLRLHVTLRSQRQFHPSSVRNSKSASGKHASGEETLHSSGEYGPKECMVSFHFPRSRFVHAPQILKGQLACRLPYDKKCPIGLCYLTIWMLGTVIFGGQSGGQ